MLELTLRGEYIELDKLLKATGLVESGGQIGEIVDMCQPIRDAAASGADAGTPAFMKQWAAMGEKLIELARAPAHEVQHWTEHLFPELARTVELDEAKTELVRTREALRADYERHGIVGEYWYDRKTRRVVLIII